MRTALRCVAGYWSQARVMRKAAALAYYAAFSVAPLLVVALAAASLFADARGLERHVLDQVGSLVGRDTADWLAGVLARTSATEGGIAALVAGVVVLVGATTALAELKDGLDEIFAAPPRAEASWWSFLRARAFALGLILTLAFLLVVSLFANALLVAFAAWTTAWLGGDVAPIVVGELVTFSGTAALFASVYAWLPSAAIGWRGILRATLISTALFAAGRWIVSTWIASADEVSVFGAAGAFAVVLLWVYWSAIAFYSGAVLAVATGACAGDARLAPPRAPDAPDRTLPEPAR